MATRTSTAHLANEAWETLFRAQATLAREFEHGGDWGAFPPREYGVLYAVATEENGLRITDLMDDVLLSQAGVSRLVARLERRGLVERLDDPDDGRACRIVLTEEGRKVQRHLGRKHAQHVTEVMTRALTPEQLETLRALGQALLAAAPPVTRTSNANSRKTA